MHRHVGGLVDGGQAGGAARVHQVAGDLGLAVDHHRPAAGQRLQVDAVALAAEGQLDAIVHQALAVHALAHARLVEQVDADLLQHAGADAAEHVVGAALLEHDVVDAGLVQQLAEQQAGRAGADDDDLGAAGKGHGCLLGVGSTARA